MSDILIKNMKMPDKATTIVVFPEGKARVFRQDIDHDEWLTAIEVPSADVAEVKHGKWEEGCSVCGSWNLFDFDGYNCESNFCPNCGADMRMDGGT